MPSCKHLQPPPGSLRRVGRLVSRGKRLAGIFVPLSELDNFRQDTVLSNLKRLTEEPTP